MCKGGWLRGSADWGIVPLARQVGLHHEVTIPQSASLTAPFTQGSLLSFYTNQKPGRTFLFAPAVLLLRSHSLITLTRYFSDCTLVFMGDHPNFCDFVKPFQDLSYLFIGLTLWFVICLKAFVERGKIGFKIGPGVLGLMLRTAPLNSCTLECLLVDQMKFRFFLFGGVVTVIATDLLSS